MTKKMQKITLAFLVIVMVIVMLGNSTDAQSVPELLVSWKANNSVPPNFVGKVLPINGTRIDLGMDLLENNRLIDLSNYTIRWFVNDQLKQSGRGLRSISFVADALGGDDSVRVVVVGYRGSNVSKNITIPIIDPELVIDAPFPGNLIIAGTNQIKALLYFFNISGLDQISFNWTANGAATAENASNILELDTRGLPSRTTVGIEAQAQNIRQTLERASAEISLKIR